jgi:hypothetical protein
MTNNDRTLSEAELDVVSGGLRDRPWVDYLNHQNKQTGGFGASIVDAIPGLVMKDSGPDTPGHPVGSGT